MVETIHQLRDKLNEYWQGLEKNKKIKILIISVISILSIIILSIILTRTNYEILYQNLTLEDMSDVTDKLDELGIEWKTPDDNPTTVMVPEKMKNQAKIGLAADGLPKDGYSFIDAFNDSSWTMTDYDKKERMKLALQSELSSTISEIDGVEKATAYIDEEDDKGFVLDENIKETSASIFIERSTNRPLSGETITAIQNLVASSVNMDPERVQIVDNEGKLLTGEEEESDLLMTDQLNIKSGLESKINDSIKDFLENVFGEGNIDVRSSVKMNFDSEKTNIVEFSPPVEGSEEGLIRSMEEIEEQTVSGASGGVPGTDENPPDYEMVDDGQDSYDKKSSTINFELNEINKEIRKAQGQVEDITVAVLINKDVLIDGNFTPETETEIEELIYAATGLDTSQVRVNAQSFISDEVADIQENGMGMNWLAIAIILVAIALVAGLIIYRRKRNKESEELEELQAQMEEEAIRDEMEDIEFETEESKVKSQIERFVDKKPESVAQLLRTWLNE
ncbi:flagellar M-ring protein FliF [Schnuerera sp. xch1]|uniref:flagellar basal-body MS-ring/collar protein FliF n=1 Tax=Schnuerera sp. xch1 TaxID=2874283 RepID=UPI001CBF1890|nr:flagellar basal-body MS-ring/collar protein FliF [Schnuerera sp. xch1]MBZ2173879.1 flagellar M-ring protein FliF [Schnuerera sp. xch1]